MTDAENRAYKKFMLSVALSGGDKIANQIDVTRPFTFGAKIYVMLITDRLFSCADSLREYMRNSVDVVVDLVYSVEEARLRMPDRQRYDFLIIVGYLESAHNYDIIKEIKKINKDVITIMYARPDFVIKDECRRHKIEHAFSREDPVASFIDYMRTLYDGR